MTTSPDPRLAALVFAMAEALTESLTPDDLLCGRMKEIGVGIKAALTAAHTAGFVLIPQAKTA